MPVLYWNYPFHFYWNMADKLNRIKVTEKLRSIGILVFTPREFAGIFGVPLKRAMNFISSNRESGLFVKLRNNFYMLKYSTPDYACIANRLYQPSYISLETALSHYGIIPEVVYATTSITTKASRTFGTPIGDFIYQHIKIKAFTGYRLEEIDRYKALYAEPEKALADYLYFVDLKRVSLNDRLYLKKIRKSQLVEYAILFERPSLLKLIDDVYAHARKPRTIY